jgi:hypothetical protein
MKAVAICRNDNLRPIFKMKNGLAILLIFIAASALPACGKKEEAAPVQNTVEIERQRERADREQKAREAEQQKREEAEDRADSLKTMVLVVAITGVISTLVGIAIGSSARKKAEKARANE